MTTLSDWLAKAREIAADGNITGGVPDYLWTFRPSTMGLLLKALEAAAEVERCSAPSGLVTMIPTEKLHALERTIKALEAHVTGGER